MRRMPYVVINNGNVNYMCPSCKQVLTRSQYKMNYECPYCKSFINRTAKKIMQFYLYYDKSMYDYFIYVGGRKI